LEVIISLQLNTRYVARFVLSALDLRCENKGTNSSVSHYGCYLTILPIEGRAVNRGLSPLMRTFLYPIIVQGVIHNIFFSYGSVTPRGLLIIEASRSHSHTPHPVGLLWASDQPNVEISTWQHTIPTRHRHPTGGIRTRDPSKPAAADPRLRPYGHWNRRT
jgi:hypothetical protein